MMPLAELVFRRAEERGQETALRFGSKAGWEPWTWGHFWGVAAAKGAALAAAGVRPGDHVLVLIPDPAEAVGTLFGVWAAGAVPIQVALPYRMDDIPGFLAHLRATGEKVDARCFVTTKALAAFSGGGSERVPVLISEKLAGEAGTDALSSPVGGAGDAPALVQLTSGSLDLPKAVMIPRPHLVGHLEAISEALPADPSDDGVSWLPLFHDMGLIGGLLYPLYNRFVVNLMSPLDFRNKPYRWLQALSEFRATHTAAPPSAFAVATRLGRRAAEDGLDLSRLRCAMVGAEPIPPRVLRAFSDAFAATGFRDEAFFPVYGLAEATVAVSFPPVLAPTRYDAVDRDVLTREGKAVAVDAETTERPVFEVTGVGSALPGVSVRVVGDDFADLPERTVGEVLVRTAHGMSGYYRDADATREAYRGGWLRTGDLGYLADGDLFITGRLKELIIRGGENLVPTAIEELVEGVEGVRRGCVAAVGVRSETLSTERAVVVAETRQGPDAWPALEQAIRAHLAEHGIEVDEVRLAKPGTIPKTTSGKLKRAEVAASLAS